MAKKKTAGSSFGGGPWRAGVHAGNRSIDTVLPDQRDLQAYLLLSGLSCPTGICFFFNMNT